MDTLQKWVKRYKQHTGVCKNKLDALGQPVRMLMTFDEWLDVWKQSGKEPSRGGFVMARKHDIGHYEPGNVFITTCTANLNDPEVARRAAITRRAVMRTPEVRQKVSAGVKKSVVHRDGIKRRSDNVVWRASVAEAMRLKWQDPEFRKLRAIQIAKGRQANGNGAS